MESTIRDDPEDSSRRLGELGLDENILLAAVRRGQLARASLSPFYPTSFPGLAAWAETIAALREELCPRGWHSVSESNYCLVESPDRIVAIAVATGDEATGRRNEDPQTKSSKGKKTVQAISSNVRQLNMFEIPGIEIPESLKWPSDRATRQTWLLLIHSDEGEEELRCELSLPTALDKDDRVVDWAERILLPSTPLDGYVDDIPASGGPEGPDDEFEIQRRA